MCGGVAKEGGEGVGQVESRTDTHSANTLITKSDERVVSEVSRSVQSYEVGKTCWIQREGEEGGGGGELFL